jgi:dipeptidyl aminopeptidase/acylaminoacyl peptidase
MMSWNRGWSAAFALLCLVLTGAEPPAVAARVPLETFADNPAVGRPKLSPNGRYIAAPLWRGKDDGVAVYEVDAPPNARIKRISLPADLDVDWVEWANDDRLLISLSKSGLTFRGGLKINTSLSRVIALDRDGQNMVVLFANSRRHRGNFDLSEIVHSLPDDPNSVLMAANDNRNHNNLYRVNVYDGKAELVARGGQDTFQWLTDLKGEPRARWDFRPRFDRVELLVRAADGDWERVAHYGFRDLPTLNIVGFGDDPRIALVASRQTGDRYALHEYDTTTRTLGKVLFQHPRVDVGEPVGGPIYDPASTKLIGVYYVDDVWERHYFDPEFAALQGRLDATFKDAAIIRMQSWSADRSRFVIFTSGPKDPGTYYVFDVKSGRATLIGRLHPNIPPNELGEMIIIKYKARDGTPIPGYLTMPPGRGDKNLPMVVMPHGGPEHRDYVQYDQWAQMLANRGYLVFQPNFRGSGGYGKTFAEAGYRQWGRRMQDDVTDGVQALIADGTADPNRICIVGASYGGYAALAGGAFTPDLYRCVLAIAAVADLPAFLETREKQLGDESAIYDYWIRLLGDPKTDLQQMQSVSPALQASKFKAPVLLIHGDEDDNVPIDQSQRMEKALQAAGKQVRFVTINGEGHNFSKRSSDIKVMSEMEAFLAATLGGSTPGIAGRNWLEPVAPKQ